LPTGIILSNNIFLCLLMIQATVPFSVLISMEGLVNTFVIEKD
jgi:hypothetical protein